MNRDCIAGSRDAVLHSVARRLQTRTSLACAASNVPLEPKERVLPLFARLAAGLALATSLFVPLSASAQASPSEVPTTELAPVRVPAAADGPLFTTYPRASGSVPVTIHSDEGDTVVSHPEWYGDTRLCTAPCTLFATGRPFVLAVASPSHLRSVHAIDGATPVDLRLSTRDHGRAVAGAWMIGLGAPTLVLGGLLALTAATTGNTSFANWMLVGTGSALGLVIAGAAMILTAHRDVVVSAPARRAARVRWAPGVVPVAGGALAEVGVQF